MSSAPLSYVMNLLARREYSEYEIYCKMQAKDFSEEEIKQTLTQCQQKNWQNDRRFTENYINSYAQRGYGRHRIRQELRNVKGIPPEIIEETLAACEIDWHDIVLSVLRKKYPDYRAKMDLKTKQKIWRYMLSRGFYTEEFSDLVNSEISADSF